MLKLICSIGGLMTIIGVAGGCLNKNMIYIGIIGLILMAIPYIFLSKDEGNS